MSNLGRAACIVLVLAAGSASAQKVAVTAHVFTIADSEALKFLQNENPVGNPDQSLAALEEQDRDAAPGGAKKLGEITVTTPSGLHAAGETGSIAIEVEPTVAPDGGSVAVTAELTIGARKIRGTVLMTAGRFCFFGLGADGSALTYLVYVGVRMAK